MAGGTEAKDRAGIGSAVTSATAARQLRNGWRRKPTVATRWVGKTVAYIERRQLEQRDKSGRTRSVVRYKVRYRDAAGKPHSETKRRLVDAERRKAEIELDVGNGLWRDPRRGEIRLEKRAADWIQQNLADFYTGPPTTTTGSVWLHDVGGAITCTPAP